MPKKSKREKIIAELRRQNTLPLTNTDQYQKGARETVSKHYVFKLPLLPQEPLSKNSDTALNKPPVTFIYQDIRRITALTILALSFEAMLYWLIQRNILPIPRF